MPRSPRPRGSAAASPRNPCGCREWPSHSSPTRPGRLSASPSKAESSSEGHHLRPDPPAGSGAISECRGQRRTGQSRAGSEVHLAADERGRARRADNRRDRVVAAGQVGEEHGRAVVSRPAVPPGDQRHQDGYELAGLVRGYVLVSVRPLLVAVSLHHAVVKEGVQSGLEDVARDAQMVVDLIEAVPAETDIPEYEQRPPLAHDLQGPGQRAGQGGKVGFVHCIMLLTTGNLFPGFVEVL